MTGVEIAQMLGEEPEHVFKTLVTIGKSKEHYVFMVPVAEELDLKKAAKAAGEKSIEITRALEAYRIQAGDRQFSKISHDGLLIAIGALRFARESMHPPTGRNAPEY